MKQAVELEYIKHYLEEALKGASPELAAFRRQSLQKFFNLGLPDKKNEKWKYTPVAAWFHQQFNLEQAHLAGKSVSVELVADDNLVEVTSYVEACKNVDFVRAMNQKDHQYNDSFLALNEAISENGIVIKIKRGKVIEKPIRIQFKAENKNVREMLNWRVHIELESGAHAQVIEEYTGQGEYFTNVVTSVTMAENSRLEFVRIQSESPKALHIGQLLVRQEKDSHLHALSLSLGSALARQSWEVDSMGASTESILNGLYLVRDRQHSDTRTSLNHHVPLGYSRQLFKGLIMDEGRGVFNGRIYIAPNAVKVDSKQLNHNLLLSSGAEADSKPELEIYADDVKANHGASIGQMSPEELFYLQSRGISPDEAIRMLAEGYVHEVLGGLNSGPLKELIYKKVDEAFVGYKSKVVEVLS